jgi:thioredoxin 1
MKNILFFCLVMIAFPVFAQTKLEANAFEKKLVATPQAQVLDVRTKAEFSENHLAQALQADYNNPAEFADRTRFLDKSKPVFVYCLGGGRSAGAAEKLTAQGYTVFDLQGGMRAWQNADKPYEKTAPRLRKAGLSEADFEKLLAHENKLVLVDFGAKWCPPCKKLTPILAEIAQENASKLRLLTLDVDENETLAKAKNVTALPVLMLFKNGKLVWQQEGFAERQVIEAQIAKANR